jgi:hypothetical protein
LSASGPVHTNFHTFLEDETNFAATVLHTISRNASNGDVLLMSDVEIRPNILESAVREVVFGPGKLNVPEQPIVDIGARSQIVPARR